jgi:energy-converting hydrogenase Eha subunit C
VYKLITLSSARVNALVRAVSSAYWDVVCVGSGFGNVGSIMAYLAAG